MGNAFCTSCCHRHAKLKLIEKAVNVVLGCLLPLAEIAHEGLTEMQQQERLADCRQKARGLSHGGYKKALVGKWVQAEKLLPRCHGDGPDIRVLIHTPVSPPIPSQLPIVIWCHGGGLTINDCMDNYGADLLHEVEESFCWVSVDYRLAPEAKFPAPMDDVVSVYKSLQDAKMAMTYGYSVARIGLAGVSAGGYVVAYAAAQLAKLREMPAFLASMYPMVDPHMNSNSWDCYGDLPACPSSWIRKSWEWFLSSENEALSEAAMNAASLLNLDFAALRGLPTLIVLGLYDPLHDEGADFAKLVSSAGLHTLTISSPGSHALAHAFDKSAKSQIMSWWKHVFCGTGHARTAQ